ncbi:MAG: isochorismatase family protein [Nitrospira sp.]|nr:isochorismatase family protein [Nitrospira sp.]MCP9462436.1 isochorismatase family protein [Nitrospira sp.]MCP9473648.1 isochorismatase family protein [Nitrospira sp.]
MNLLVETLDPHDALILIDIQNDFLPGGPLGVAGSATLLPVWAEYLHRFVARRLSVFFTRDWHPQDHCSFQQQGGPWPPHCLAGSHGALPPDHFPIPASAVIIYKGIDPDHDAYSGFQGTALHRHLQALDVRRLFIGGLATDYCVLNTVKDALSLGYAVRLLTDAIKAVDVRPDDGKRAEHEMIRLGAVPIRLEDLAR